MSKEIAIATFNEAVDKQVDVLKSMGIGADLYKRVLLNALIRDPKLAKCSKSSLYQSVISAAEAGVVPNGQAGALVALNIKGTMTAQFWIMVPGMIARAHQATPDISINSAAVMEGDEWEHREGTDPHIDHAYSETALRNWDNLKAVYAVAFFPNNPGRPQFEVMYRAEIETFKKNVGPWLTHGVEMAKARVLKRLLKRLPMPVGFMAQPAMADEDEDFYGDGLTIDGEAEEVPPEQPTQQQPRQRRRNTGKTQQRQQQQAQPAKEPEPDPDPPAQETDQGSIQFEDDNGADADEAQEGDMF